MWFLEARIVDPFSLYFTLLEACEISTLLLVYWLSDKFMTWSKEVGARFRQFPDLIVGNYCNSMCLYFI